MKSYTLDIKVGDKVEVGRWRNVMATVRDIEVDEHGQPVIITCLLYTSDAADELMKLSPGAKTPKQILLERNKTKKS